MDTLNRQEWILDRADSFHNLVQISLGSKTNVFARIRIRTRLITTLADWLIRFSGGSGGSFYRAKTI